MDKMESKHCEDIEQCQIIISEKKDVEIRGLRIELDQINQDIERQVNIKLNDKYENEKDLNESIIKYQRE